MSEKENALELRHTVAQRIAMRDKALKDMDAALSAYRDAIAAIDKAQKDLMTASSVPYMESQIMELFNHWGRRNGCSPTMSEIQEAQRSDMWHGVVTTCSIWQLMDAKARKDFKMSLRDTKAPFTEENALSTLLNIAPQTKDFFRRGLVNVFCSLSTDYRSNDQFKVGKKIVIARAYTPLFGYMGEHMASRLDDLERAFYTLDGKRFGETQKLSQVLYRQNDVCAKGSEGVDTPYFIAKAFKNGNVHLVVKDAKLLKACNKEIAAHFGDALAKSNAA